jgi:3-oxoacyl-[acyl-carrier-protein] synthase-3
VGSDVDIDQGHFDDRGGGTGSSGCVRAGSTLAQGLAAVPYTTGVWAARFPDLARILADAPCAARHNAIVDNAYCDDTGAGFIDALALADGFVRAQNRSVLVVAANILSRRINPTDASTSALFGDAAGAVVLSPAPGAASGVLAVDLVSDGAGYDLIKIPAGGSRMPFAHDLPLDDFYMQMLNGQSVFSKAVDIMVRSSERVLAVAGVTADDVAHWIPHQANLRITAAVERRLGLDPARGLSTLRDFGNSSAATIPLALDVAVRDGRIKQGDLVAMPALGAGLTWGCCVISW